MKSIPLTQGKFAIVDDEDFERLSKFNYQFNGNYAIRQTRGIFRRQKTIYMHREILQTPDNLFTDHINGNKLDNRKINLRVCNKQQNKANSIKPSNNSSGIKGVYWRDNRKCWEARIVVNGKSKYSSGHATCESAKIAYYKMAKRYFGDFARLDD